MAGEGTLTPSPRPPRWGLRKAIARHPWRTAALILGSLVILALAALFNPTLQQRWLLPKLVPLAEAAGVDLLAVDYLHLTPWSLELRGVHAGYRGLDLRLDVAELGVNPFGLVTDTIVVHELRVPAAKIDLTNFRPGPPSDTPFAGVLHLLDTGFGLALYDIDVRADVQLDRTRRLHVELRGDDIRPHVASALHYTLDYVAAEQRVDAQGTLHLEQLSGGRFRALRTVADARVAAAALPAPERAAFTLSVTPIPGTGHVRAEARERRRAGEEVTPFPEAVSAAVSLLDAQGEVRARLDFDGRYHGADGQVRGIYTLDANQALAQPYVGSQALPALALKARGALGLQTVTGALDLTTEAVTQLSALSAVLGDNPALPDALNLHSAFTLALHGERLVVTRFEHVLGAGAASAEVPTTPLLSLVMQPPLVVELDAPAAILATPRALGTLVIDALPLPWINGLLQGQSLQGGTLNAAFELAVAEERRLELLPLTALTLGTVAVNAGEDVLLPALKLSLQPRLTLSDERLRLRLDEVLMSNDERRLLGGKIVLTQPLTGPPATGETPVPDADGAAHAENAALPPLRVSYTVDADVDAVRELPPLAARREEWPLPAGLRLKAKGKLDLRGTEVTIASLDAGLAQAARPELLKLVARQAFVLPGGDGSFENPRGELAALALRDFDLAWLTPFVPDLALRGSLANADLLLTAPAAGRYAVTATAPLRLDDLQLTLGGEVQLSALDVVATPKVDYSSKRVRFDVQDLRVSSAAHVLVRGDLSGNLPLVDAAPEPLGAEGRLELDLTRLAAQPALQRALGRAAPDLALNGSVDFAASQVGDTIRLARLAVDLDAARDTHLALRADKGLELRPSIGPDERLARHVVGDMRLGIRGLSSAVIEHFIALEGIAFAGIDADLRLRSDGAVLHADSVEPLRIDQVRITDGDALRLAPFSVGTRASVDVKGRQLSVDVAAFDLSFTGSATPALSGRAAATIEPGRTVPLTTLDTAFAAHLPQWLSQPVAMPGHKLTAGELNAKIAVTPDGAIAARVALEGLAADAALAMSQIVLPVTGRMDPDGRGFSFAAPLSASGRSGVSNATVDAVYAPVPDKRSRLKLRVDSELFYLNDLLATLAAVSPQAQRGPSVAADTDATATPVAIDRTRDEKAAWDVLPYGTGLDYRIGKLYYTDYLAFDEVKGVLSIRKRLLIAKDLSARFHDSPLHLDGTLEYRKDEAEPYLLDVDGTVQDFNLNQFFKELVPGERPRIKGLFSVKLEADGEMPNLGQLRNETLFDVRMTSREGVFRPLPPSSSLFVGTSNLLGVVGETLSYVPTGGFGAGTIARLVNYITRINYEIIDIRVRRAESRDVVIERFLVRSPTISMTARGGITHVPGKDIVDSPLDLRANLDMSGRGAAILYSMGLLENERNKAGYWHGPEFKIWGTAAAAESNFAEIIRRASDGTVKGGFTRPLSGLIGNLKYRWFGEDPQPLPPELAREVEALEAEAEAETVPAQTP